MVRPSNGQQYLFVKSGVFLSLTPDSDSPTSVTQCPTMFGPSMTNYSHQLKSMFFWPLTPNVTQIRTLRSRLSKVQLMFIPSMGNNCYLCKAEVWLACANKLFSVIFDRITLSFRKGNFRYVSTDKIYF